MKNLLEADESLIRDMLLVERGRLREKLNALGQSKDFAQQEADGLKENYVKVEARIKQINGILEAL